MITLLGTIDSLRYDHIDQLAQTREIFQALQDRAFSTSTATPWGFSVIVGVGHPAEMGLQEGTSVANHLSSNRAGITTNHRFSELHGYDEGFDLVLSESRRILPEGPSRRLSGEENATPSNRVMGLEPVSASDEPSYRRAEAVTTGGSHRRPVPRLRWVARRMVRLAPLHGVPPLLRSGRRRRQSGGGTAGHLTSVLRNANKDDLKELSYV